MRDKNLPGFQKIVVGFSGCKSAGSIMSLNNGPQISRKCDAKLILADDLTRPSSWPGKKNEYLKRGIVTMV